MAADRADEPTKRTWKLKATSFSAGEWGGIPIPLAMDDDMVAGALGTAAAQLGAMTPLTLVCWCLWRSSLSLLRPAQCSGARRAGYQKNRRASRKKKPVAQ